MGFLVSNSAFHLFRSSHAFLSNMFIPLCFLFLTKFRTILDQFVDVLDDLNITILNFLSNMIILITDNEALVLYQETEKRSQTLLDIDMSIGN